MRTKGREQMLYSKGMSSWSLVFNVPQSVSRATEFVNAVTKPGLGQADFKAALSS